MVGYRDHSLPRHRFEIFDFAGYEHAARFKQFLQRVQAIINSDPPEDVAGGLQET